MSADEQSKKEAVKAKSVALGKMTKATKEKVACTALVLATGLITGGATMLDNSPTTGCILMAIGVAVAWSTIAWMQWLPFVSTKRWAVGCGAIALAFLIIRLCLSPNTPSGVPVAQPVPRSIQYNTGDNATNIQDANVTINRSDPNVVEAVKRLGVLSVPAVGNLRQRAIELSNEIMEDLHLHGWRVRPPKQQGASKHLPVTSRMPTTGEEWKEWSESRSMYFRFRFLARVRSLRDELSQLHLRDRRLDDFLAREDGGGSLAAKRRLEQQGSIPPLEIEEIAEILKRLASQLPGLGGASPQISN